MIARDEEANIERCLTSVQALVQEIVLVDTGSVDRTVEIAKRFGARIINHTWCNDFSTPRNVSIKHARCEWILVLDADEAIDAGDHDKIRALLTEKSRCHSLTQRHYTNTLHLSDFRPAKGEFPHWEKDAAGYFESSLVRLFPNFEGIEYRGVVHELVEHSIGEKKHLHISSPGIRIHHYGHLLSPEREKRKHDLYTELGKAKTTTQPNSWKGFFEMAVQCQVNADFAGAAENFATAIEMNPAYVPSYTNAGYVLGELGKLKEAEQVLKTGIKLDQNAIEAWCNLGVIYMRANQYHTAARTLLHAVDLDKQHVNAWCNLAETFTHLGMLTQAAQSFQRVLSLLPKSARAHEGLGNCYLLSGKTSQAEDHFRAAIQIDSARSKSYYALGQIFRLTDRVQDAVQALRQFCTTEERLPRHDAQVVAAVQQEADRLQKLLP